MIRVNDVGYIYTGNDGHVFIGSNINYGGLGHPFYITFVDGFYNNNFSSEVITSGTYINGTYIKDDIHIKNDHDAIGLNKIIRNRNKKNLI